MYADDNQNVKRIVKIIKIFCYYKGMWPVIL